MAHVPFEPDDHSTPGEGLQVREFEVDLGFSVPGWATGGSVSRVVSASQGGPQVGRVSWPVGFDGRAGAGRPGLNLGHKKGSVGRVLRSPFFSPRCARQGSVGQVDTHNKYQARAKIQ